MYNCSEDSSCSSVNFIIDSGAGENLVKQQFEKSMHNIEKLGRKVYIEIT